MLLFFQNNDYGLLGYFLMLLPALFVFIGLLLGYLIIDYLIQKSLKHSLKKQSIMYGVLGGLLTIIILFTFYQGTFTETIYVAIPTSIIAFLVVRKFSKTFKVGFVAAFWLFFIAVLLLIAIFRAFALL